MNSSVQCLPAGNFPEKEAAPGRAGRDVVPEEQRWAIFVDEFRPNDETVAIWITTAREVDEVARCDVGDATVGRAIGPCRQAAIEVL